MLLATHEEHTNAALQRTTDVCNATKRYFGFNTGRLGWTCATVAVTVIQLYTVGQPCAVEHVASCASAWGASTNASVDIRPCKAVFNITSQGSVKLRCQRISQTDTESDLTLQARARACRTLAPMHCRSSAHRSTKHKFRFKLTPLVWRLTGESGQVRRKLTLEIPCAQQPW